MSTVQSSIHALELSKDSKAFHYKVGIFVAFTKDDAPCQRLINDQAQTAEQLDLIPPVVLMEKKNAFRSVVQQAYEKTTKFGAEDSVFVFDGISRLYSNVELTTLSVTIPNDELAKHKKLFRRNNGIVELTFIEEIDLGDLSSFGNEDNTQATIISNVIEMITSAHALNENNYFQIKAGRGLVSSESLDQHENRCGPGRVVVPGCIKRLVTRSDGKELKLGITIDPTKNVYYKSESLADIVIKDILGGRDNQSVRRILEEIKKENILGALAKLVHRHNGDIIKVSKFSDKPFYELEMTDKDGKQVKLYEYFQSKYPVISQVNKYLPAVEVKVKNRVRKNEDGSIPEHEPFIFNYYPMEALEILRGQQVPAPKMDPTSASTQKSINTSGPVLRKHHSFVQFVNIGLATSAKNKYLEGFKIKIEDIKLSHNLATVDKPILKIGSDIKLNIQNGKIDPLKGNMKYSEQAAIKSMTVFVSNKVRDERIIEDFIGAFKRGCQSKGIEINKINKTQYIETSNPGTLVKCLETKKHKDDTFIMLIDYKSVKSHDALKVFEQTNDILTQQVTFEVATKAPGQTNTMANIINKTNVKNGGVCVSVGFGDESMASFDLNKSKTLYIGLDLSTAIQTQIKGNVDFNSVGWTANVGKNKSQFIGDYFYQKRNVLNPFIIDADQMKVVFKSILKKWRDVNKEKGPEKVIIFRSGLNAEQFKIAFNDELKEFRALESYAAKIFGKKCAVPISIVHVNRGSNVRFFGQDDRTRVPTNVGPGSFVSHKFSHPGKVLFYAKTNPSCLGTAKMPQFCLTFDENNLTTDVLQNIVNMLSFGIDIIGAAVSLPVCTYQAIELTKRAANNIGQMNDLGLLKYDGQDFEDNKIDAISRKFNYTTKINGANRFNA
uniref:Piwi domain-containing protein n=1 Tax=Rhabditophanes sp. KR3021 TaxID=114890 RepID=A0AC35TMP9_9BILA